MLSNQSTCRAQRPDQGSDEKERKPEAPQLEDNMLPHANVVFSSA
jgi:hypothetical protein